MRLTAIRSLFAYAALRHPEHALLIQRVLAIPPKRFDKRIVTFLTATEIDALIEAPDQTRWEVLRDRDLCGGRPDRPARRRSHRPVLRRRQPGHRPNVRCEARDASNALSLSPSQSRRTGGLAHRTGRTLG